MIGNKTFSYKPYVGTDSFAFFGCTKEDETLASNIADILVGKGFRLFLDARGDKHESSSIELSNSINVCSGAIVFISKNSIETLAFRNIINNLISANKPLVIIKIGEFELTHGLDMQLANSNIISYTNVGDTVENILESNVLTQSMIGEGMEELTTDNRKTVIMIAMIAIGIAIFALSAIGVVNKRMSPEYLLKDINNLEYLNIAKFGDSAITTLEGKNFDELDLSGGNFNSLNGIENIYIKTINVSNITGISLSQLKNVQGLEIVKISQDQIKYADELVDAGLEVIIIH